MQPALHPQFAVCLWLTRAIGKARSIEDIYAVALDALAEGLRVARASILLFDPDGVMRFKAYRGLSETYRRAVEGHTPWRPDSAEARPVVIADVRAEPALAELLPVILAEGVAAMTFVPLIIRGCVIGKFVAYSDSPRTQTAEDVHLAEVIASLVAFAVEHMRAEEHARRSEERLRFALDAALTGTWDWDIGTGAVRWSDNLERMHGLGPGSFDGTFASYEREIHPEDRERVLAALRRALEKGTPYDVEYRIVKPDGTAAWVEGKGHVQYDGRGVPVRMTGVCILATRRKEAELARLASAEEASRLKDEFLATLSHELRTPMNAVIGWVQLLNAGALPPDRIRQAIEVIDRNARLQAQLVEDLLDVSRIVSGKLEIQLQPVSITQVIENVISSTLPATDAKRIALTLEVGERPQVLGDPKRLEQVVANVLSNAVKFTPEGGRIDVRCRIADAAIEIEVADTGVGIAPEFLPYVFDRFRQADSRSTRRHGGLGLGLSITRHLLHLHRGEIHAYSDGEGCGTRIIIRIPAAVDPPVQPRSGKPRERDAGGDCRTREAAD